MPQHEILKHTESEVRKIYDINAIAHCWTFQAFLPKMIEKNEGHIVALSSIAGIVGLNNLVPYCGSKFAVRGTMESLGEELRNHSNGKSKVNLIFTQFWIYLTFSDFTDQIYDSLSIYGRHGLVQESKNPLRELLEIAETLCRCCCNHFSSTQRHRGADRST